MSVNNISQSFIDIVYFHELTFSYDNVQLRHFALRFIHSHSGATGVISPICRVVYFRCGAKLTDTSSKIDVHRLKVGFTNTFICALVDLVFLVLGRS